MPSNVQPAPNSLLGLPRELRDMVYDNMLPMLDNHIGRCRGLLLTCRQIREEYEAEATEKIQKLMMNIKKEWDQAYGTELRISVSGFRGVHVSIPLSFIRATNCDRSEKGDSKKGHSRGTFPPALLPLIPLHLSCLDFSFYEDEEGKTPPHSDQHSEFLRHMYDIMEKRILIHIGSGRSTLLPYRLETDRLRIEWGPDDWTNDYARPPLFFSYRSLDKHKWYETSRKWGWEGNVLETRREASRDEYTWQKSEIVWDRLYAVAYNTKGEIESRGFARELH